MNVTLRLRIMRVSFGADDGPLEIYVEPQYVDGDTIITRGQIEHLQKTQADAAKLAGAGGEWGNAEIEQLVRADQKVDRPALLGRPAVPPVYDGDNKTEIRPGVPAIEPTPPTYKPRYAADAVIVWGE